MFLPRAGSPRTPMLPAMMEGVEAAVIGGGAIGPAVARALAGVERVVLLEKEPAVGQGSTARANGGYGPSSPGRSTSPSRGIRSRSSSGSLVNMAEVLG